MARCLPIPDQVHKLNPVLSSHMKVSPILLILALGTSILNAFAYELATIENILSNATSYQLHSVGLQGTAANVQRLGQYVNTGCGYIFDSYTFTLSDGTGNIHVIVPGPCGTPWMPKDRLIAVSDGDKVLIEALINVLPMEHTDYPSIQAVAKKILRLDTQ